MNTTNSKTSSLKSEPLQNRSRASFERMLRAAQELLIETGNDSFTLNDVGEAGNVSIGSIYNRFKSKDELLQTVHGNLVESINSEISEAISIAKHEASNLNELTEGLVRAMLETLGRHAPLLRPFMVLATTNPVVQQKGNAGLHYTEELLLAALLQCENEILHTDKARAALASIRIVYASVARDLSFGIGSVEKADWQASDLLINDLSRMWAAFLKLPD